MIRVHFDGLAELRVGAVSLLQLATAEGLKIVVVAGAGFEPATFGL